MPAGSAETLGDLVEAQSEAPLALARADDDAVIEAELQALKAPQGASVPCAASPPREVHMEAATAGAAAAGAATPSQVAAPDRFDMEATQGMEEKGNIGDDAEIEAELAALKASRAAPVPSASSGTHLGHGEASDAVQTWPSPSSRAWA